MCEFFTSVSKSFTLYFGLFIGLSLIPELLLIGVNCASYLYISSDDYDQRRLIIWSLSLACVIFLLKVIQIPFVSMCSAYYHRNYLLPLLVLWIALNLGNFILGILISLHLNKEKKEHSLRQSFLHANIALLSIILGFMLFVCCNMIGRICWVIYQDDNRL
jgi:uncharacterized membrane protein